MLEVGYSAMSPDAATPWYRSAAEMSAAGIDLYPVTGRVATKVADRSSGSVLPAAAPVTSAVPVVKS